MAGFGYNIAPGTSAESLALRRRLAEQLLGQDREPVRHWAQGANKIAEGLVGGYLANKADKGDAARAEQTQKMLYGLFGLGGEGAEMPAAQPASYAPTDIRPPQMGGDMTSRIVSAESGGNATARNPRSSATGRGQFIDSTWLDVMRRNKPDLVAGKADADILSMRTDPALSDEMTGVYSREVAAQLKAAGIDPTPGNVYLGYHLGPGGATKVIKSDASTPLARILPPEVMAANPHLQSMTAGRAQRWAQGKMGGAPAETPRAEAAPRIASSEKRRLRQAIAMISNPDTAALGNKILLDYLTNSEDTSGVKEYRLAQRQGYQGSFLDFQRELKGTSTKPTSSMQEYELAKQQGFDGTFMEFLTSVAGAETGAKKTAEGQVKAREALPAAQTNVNAAIDTINRLRTHPGNYWGTGATGKVARNLWGTDEYDFDALNKRASGQTFLAAREALKGAGQVTDFEGQKGEQAIANLDAAQSREAYMKALDDLERMMKASVADLQKKAGIAGGNESPAGAPKIGQTIDAGQLRGLPDNTIIEDEAGNQFRVMGGEAIPVQ